MNKPSSDAQATRQNVLQGGRPRRPTGRIIAFGTPQASTNDFQEIPFRPAYDLLESQEKGLTQDEAAAIGVALHRALATNSAKSPQWMATAKLEAIGQRTVKK